MAPFPENEIMTIKRLEVALRRSDYKLLKDGAYKLHEKFHSGHRFEYIDLLRDIYDQVLYSYSVSGDIKDILIPTIKDIFKNQGIEITSNAPQIDPEEVNRISSLTSLSYEIDSNTENGQENSQLQHEQTEEENIQENIQQIFGNFENQEQQEPAQQQIFSNDFMVQQDISSQNPPQEPTEPLQDFRQENTEVQQELQQETSEQPQEIFSQQEQQEVSEAAQEQPQEETQGESQEPTPFGTSDEFTPIKTITPAYIEENSNEAPQWGQSDHVQQQNFANFGSFGQQKEQEHQYFSNNFIAPNETQNTSDMPPFEYQQAVNQYEQQNAQQPEQKPKTISIFFGQAFSPEKMKNIYTFKNYIASNNMQINEVANLINEINMQSNISMQELQTVIEQLKLRENRVNVITNSQSADLINLLDFNQIDYGFFNFEENKKINIFPLLGLTNYFKCEHCTETKLIHGNESMPYFMQCPKCKGVMYFDLSTSNNELNMEYYNSCIEALSDSELWLLVHPLVSDKLTMDMLKCAFKVSSKVEKVCITDKDINSREAYKKMFNEINPSVDIYTAMGATEDFLNLI